MAFEITIPRLGWSMEEGTFVRWLKKDGDLIQVGEAVFELEGEKAAQDIESVDTGILRIPANAPKPGTVVAVGTVIGYLVTGDEPIPASTSASSAPVASKSTPKPAPPSNGHASEQEPVKIEESPVAAPSVRRMAREMGVKLNSISGSGPAGKILVQDLRTTPRQPAPPGKSGVVSEVASPRARRVADELGIDWRQLAGSGRDGRVRERDILQAASNSPSETSTNGVAVSSRRKTIAHRMQASHQQTAPVTLTTRIDATNLVNLRAQLKSSAVAGVVTPSYQDIVMKLTAMALQQHPVMAARSHADSWVIPESPSDYHIGFAVDTDDGLVVPVVKDVGTIGIFDLSKQAVALIEKARSGKLAASAMQGGVFTITNLGSFGIDAFTPIINLPETAILGLGRIRREAVIVDDQIVARDQITLSLSFDHRVVDGAPAARFLQTLSQAIENPSAWLLRC